MLSQPTVVPQKSPLLYYVGGGAADSQGVDWKCSFCGSLLRHLSLIGTRVNVCSSVSKECGKAQIHGWDYCVAICERNPEESSWHRSLLGSAASSHCFPGRPPGSTQSVPGLPARSQLPWSHCSLPGLPGLG